MHKENPAKDEPRFPGRDVLFGGTRLCTSRTSTTIGKTCLLSYVLATLGGLYRAFWSPSKFLLLWEDVRPVDSCTFVSKRVQDLFA